MGKQDTIVFAPNTYSYMGDALAEELGIKRGRYEDQRFKDHEDGVKFETASFTNIHKRNAIVVGGTHDFESFETFKDLIFGLRLKNARSIHAVCTYLGWARQEREGKEGEIPRGRRHVHELYQTHPTRLSFFDLHAAGITNIGDAYPRVDTNLISSRPMTVDYLATHYEPNDIVPTSPDLGRGKYVKSVANRLSARTGLPIPHVTLTKDRPQDNVTKTDPIEYIDFHQRIAFLIDDMISTGGSAIGAAELCIKANAREVHMFSPHILLPREYDCVRKLEDSPIAHFIVTNSTPRALDTDIVSSTKFTVLPIAKLVAEEVKKFW